MEDKLYYQTDKLQSLIDWKNIMKMERWAGGHDEQMKGLFKDVEVIAHWNDGDYQGQVASCVKLPTNEYVIYNDFYGSCSGCDAWEGACDDDVRTMCIGLANSAFIFKSLEDVKVFLSTQTSENKESHFDWTWDNIGENLLDSINNNLID